jgi:hypothetical protein
MADKGEVRNIIVGAAQVFVSKGDSVEVATYKTGMPAFGTSLPAAEYLETTGATNWRNVGFTSEGFEISYEPQYGEVEVDQLLDSARIFKTQLRVMLRTSMSEGTLENVRVAFGQATASQTNVVYSEGGVGTAVQSAYGGTIPGGAADNVLRLQAGSLGEAPLERSLIAVGPGPTTDSTPAKTERVYLARRVLSMETVSHALRRNEATVYPVTFRCLPDDDYANAEYGEILDRVFTS